MTVALEAELREKRASGRKLLVPYVTGGLAGWQDAIRAAAAHGADAIEIGIPFSDPVMDGPVIQEASQLALDAGIAAIVQPGGSRRDDEVVAAVTAAGAAMVFTGRRHFRH